MDNTVYVIMGSTGEYSDRREWAVVYFKEEAGAQSLVELLTAEAQRVEREIEKDSYSYYDHKYSDHWPQWWIDRFCSKYDPNFIRDYTGTKYYIINVEPGKLPEVNG